MDVFQQKISQKGYYRGLRRNRKVLNRRLRKLDAMTNALAGSREKYWATEGELSGMIAILKGATLLRRLRYAMSGNLRHLMQVKDKRQN